MHRDSSSEAREGTPLFDKFGTENQSQSAFTALRTFGSSAFGLMCPGVNATVMNLVLTLVVVESPATRGLLSSANFAGMLVGSSVFGPFLDIAGPRIAGLTTSAVAVLGSLFTTSAGTFMSLESQLLIGRVIMGIGVGGEYPVVAGLNKLLGGHQFTKRQLFIASYCMLLLGNFGQQLLYLLMVTSPLSNDFVWRALLICGGLPSFLCFLFRLKLPAYFSAARHLQDSIDAGSESYTLLVKKNFEQKKISYLALLLAWTSAHVVINLIGTYAHTLVGTIIRSSHGTPSEQTILLYNAGQAIAQGFFCFLGAASAYPVLRYLSVEGAQAFAMIVAAGMILMGIALGDRSDMIMLAIVALGQFPQGLASVTNYTIAGEMFPVEVVGTFMSIGVTVTQVVLVISLTLFPAFVTNYGYQAAQVVEALILFIGALATLGLLQKATSSSGKTRDDEQSSDHTI